MIYELRTYKLKLGRLPDYLFVFETKAMRLKTIGSLVIPKPPLIE